MNLATGACKRVCRCVCNFASRLAFHAPPLVSLATPLPSSIGRSGPPPIDRDPIFLFWALNKQVCAVDSILSTQSRFVHDSLTIDGCCTPKLFELCWSKLVVNHITLWHTLFDYSMVRADQGIQGRSAPRAKSGSSATAAIRARSSASAPKLAAQPTQITKAAKRAMKRAELVCKVNGTSRTSLLNLEPPNAKMSKSALRRQKRKQNQHLAGNTTGLKDLADAVDELAHHVQNDDHHAHHSLHMHNREHLDDVHPQTSSDNIRSSLTYPLVRAQLARTDATVTEKARKKALYVPYPTPPASFFGIDSAPNHESLRHPTHPLTLASFNRSLEMQRQNLILSDPAYTKNPFAALRLHAQNTLAFDTRSASIKR